MGQSKRGGERLDSLILGKRCDVRRGIVQSVNALPCQIAMHVCYFVCMRCARTGETVELDLFQSCFRQRSRGGCRGSTQMKHVVRPEYTQVHILDRSCFLRGLMDPPEGTRKGLNGYEISNSVENPCLIFSDGAVKSIINLLDIQRLLESCSREKRGEALMHLDATLVTFETSNALAILTATPTG